MERSNRSCVKDPRKVNLMNNLVINLSSLNAFGNEWETYEADRKNFEQRSDPEYAKNSVRPQIEEEV